MGAPYIGGRIEARVSGGDPPCDRLPSHSGKGSAFPQNFRFLISKGTFCRLLIARFKIFVYSQKLTKYIGCIVIDGGRVIIKEANHSLPVSYGVVVKFYIAGGSIQS